MTDEHEHGHGDEHGHDDEHGHGHQHHALSFEDELAAFRARKDEYFRTAHGSPIPHGRRHDFRGLR